MTLGEDPAPKSVPDVLKTHVFKGLRRRVMTAWSPSPLGGEGVVRSMTDEGDAGLSRTVVAVSTVPLIRASRIKSGTPTFSPKGRRAIEMCQRQPRWNG